MNQFGTLFKIMLYGESHQQAIGVVIDGLPPGITINYDLIKSDLIKRNPKLIGTTPRKEPDDFKITSGIFNNVTTGSPVHVMIENQSIISKDYDNIKKHPRPGHADLVANHKYKGFHDYRGGGRFSGRLTAPIVIAGSIAKMFLPYNFSHELIQVGSLKDMAQLDSYLEMIQEKQDSVGGIIQVKVKGLPIGLGEPMFEKLESKISQMLFSIPAVKGVSFGTSFEGIELLGSAFNDLVEDDTGKTRTNHSGGISGGISNGNDLIIKVFIKPTSSIKKTQETYSFQTAQVSELKIEGRHDVCIARRAGIVLENATAIVLADMFLLNKVYA
ncbi:chorismate synthase [Liberiplasma polymorphum]|uniref:chorismate synthase n=1 Tax=Liberiplasma polymorphum TaxID=3374570 RepID=UPI003775A390